MKGKARTHILLRYLQEYTDEETEVTASDVIVALAEAGEKISRPTLREDVSALQEAGYEIQVHEAPGAATSYQLTNREWSPQELQILVDAVASGQFITPSKTEEIIRKLQSMAGPADREHLVPAIRVQARHKAEKEGIYLVINAIQQAIRNDEKIRFRHFIYNEDLVLVPRHEGCEYVVSPYAMIWKNDRYYLVGNSEKHGKVTHFRIDLMDYPKQVIDETTGAPARRDPPPEGFDLEDRSDKIFSMFDGPEADVILRCCSRLVGQVVDQFGKNLNIVKRSDDSLDISVTVHLSPTFFAWVFQYEGEIRIIWPEEVRDLYKKHLQCVMDGINTDDSQ